MFKNLKAAFHTLGCKLNFSETSSIARQLTDAGFQKVSFSDFSDVYVINTCSVTENADRECKTIVNRALTRNPDAFIIVTGCFAQLKPESIARMAGVDLVLGAGEKFNIIPYLSDLRKRERGEVFSCDIGAVQHFIPAHSSGDRTRTFLKVQDGCDYSCTFCTIPLARGGSRSGTVAQVVSQVEALVAQGAKEIVLTGVNLGDFGKPAPDLQPTNRFYDLAMALDNLDLPVRYRISSIEPNLLSAALINLVASSSRFAPHFHIPLQSGSDRILKSMKRRYLTSLYAGRISYIKSVMPHACIGVDVIVGFPGETDDDFLATYDFLRDLDVSYLHVFTYSERDHTPAISLPGTVPMGVRKTRNNMLRILSKKKLQAFYRSRKGRTEEVLFEKKDNDGFLYGYTGNYIRIKATYQPELEQTLCPVFLDRQDEEGHYLFQPDVSVPAYS